MVKSPKSVEVKLDLKVFSVSGVWEPNNVEREAAWELYVELITRVGVVPFRDGLYREALTSLHSLFGSSREVLRRHGPEVAEAKKDGQYNLAYIVVTMLNFALRPVLSYWHPELSAWEHARPLDKSPVEHEREWERLEELRLVVDDLQGHLMTYANLLASACGVPRIENAFPV